MIIFKVMSLRHIHNNCQVLYEKVENGKLVNFDPTALEPLIAQYLTQPQERLGVFLLHHKSKARNISFHLQEKYDPIPWRYKPGI